MADSTPHHPTVPAVANLTQTSDIQQAEAGPGSLLSTLLCQPAQVIGRLHAPGTAKRLGLALAMIAIVCLAIYGLVVGSFSGGNQFWVGPLKIVVGSLLTLAICYPSLYVFLCLSGASDKLRLDALAGVMMAAVALSSLLLVSLAPIAWVFSQSTDSIAFIASFHFVFWLIGLAFGLKLIGAGARFLGVVDHGYLLFWMTIFVLVSFQMMTTLRPILGSSNHFLPAEKQFFLQHWIELFAGVR